MSLMPPPMKQTRPAQAIVAAYLTLRETNAEDLIHGRSAARALSRARQELMWLLRDLTHLSPVAIGQLMGGRDEATVRHGIDRVSDLLAHDDSYRQQLLAVRRAILDHRPAAAMAPDLCLTAVRSVLSNPALTDAEARKAALQLMEAAHA